MNTVTAALPSEPVSLGLGNRLSRLGASLMSALEAVGRARARRHLLDFADRCQDLQPELAKELRSAARDSGSV